LVIAVMVKLALLTTLWWLFVRDARIQVDADQTAAQIGATTSPPGVSQ